MKIIVYAICKNEEKFVKRFMQNASEADKVCVLDTGSTDNTVGLLRECGATVKTKVFENWRFDIARNLSLQMVDRDADLCVCLDLDEVIEKGWRKKLESQWNGTSKQLKYLYVWSHTESGKDGYVFYSEKIHAREGFYWYSPVHEVLKYVKDDYSFQTIDLRVDHYPDQTKSRSNYLPLLELAVKEAPENDRNMHYLGREYMFACKYNKAITVLMAHLRLKSAIWKDERCASMRYIGKCFECLKDYQSAENYYIMATLEAPFLREPFVDLATFYYNAQEYLGALFYIEKALKITAQTQTYITEPTSFSEYPYDIASICCYRLGLIEKSLYYEEKALQLCPENQRIIENIKIIKQSNIKDI